MDKLRLRNLVTAVVVASTAILMAAATVFAGQGTGPWP